MNELIKFKNKYKYKSYNRIPNDDVKTNVIIHDIMSEIVEKVVSTHQNDIQDNKVSKSPSPKNNNMENTLSVIEENECRICFEEETPENPFIWPCRCKGTSRYVHESCLDKWRYESVGTPAFEICMECRYKYKFQHQYPYEFHTQISINACVIMICINMLPLLFTYFMSQVDLVNDHTIIRTIMGENNTLVQHIVNNPRLLSSLSYNMYYNMILTVQSWIFMSCYVTYICKTVHRKKQFFKKLMKSWFFYFFFMFKFPLLFQTLIDDIAWTTVFVTISTIFIFFEPMNYIILFKKHNSILIYLDTDNSYTLRNYNEEDDTPQLNQQQLQLYIEELQNEYSIQGVVVSP